jgi:pseudaminic acid cytidylyltransferase
VKSLAIITARGGSKRIPGKNIRPFLGKPAISWPVQVALQAGCFDEVMVSTDDTSIVDVARAAGASVPFLRSALTSDDHSTLADVVQEVLATYKKNGVEFDMLCCILGTAFFLQANLLREAFSLVNEKDCDGVMPVVRYNYPVQRALKKDDAGNLDFIAPEYRLTRSQDLVPAYHDAGQFYVMKVPAFEQQGKIILDRMQALELPWYAAVDIDEEEDWARAEILFKALGAG